MNDRLLHFRKPIFESLETRRLLDASNTNETVLESIYSSVVSAQTSSIKLMQFKIQLVDTQGNPIEKVYVDDEFLLQVFVKDLRQLPSDTVGIFTAFATLRLDRLLERTGEGRVGNGFFTLKDMDPARTEIGGMSSSIEPNGTDPLLLFEVPVKAIADGESTISTAPIEGYRGSVMLPMLQYGFSEPTPTSSIDFASLPITVLPRTSVTPSESDPTAKVSIETIPTVTAPNSPQITVVNQPSRRPIVINGTFSGLKDDTKSTESENDESSRGKENDLVAPEANNLLVRQEPISTSARPFNSTVLGRLSLPRTLDSSSAELFSPANKSNISANRSQSMKPSAVEVVDAILNRLEASDFSPIHFEWENTFERAPLSRLPLNGSRMSGSSKISPYGNDVYTEVNHYFGFLQALAANQNLEPSSQSANEDLTYQRAPLPTITLLASKEDEPIASQEFSTEEISKGIEVAESSESKPDSRLLWLSRLIVGLLSLFVVLDRRPTSAKPNRIFRSYP